MLPVAVTLPMTSASSERSFSKMKLPKKFSGNSMTSERWVTLISVAYQGYGRHGTCHGRHFDGGRKNCLAKIKIFIYSFFNLYFEPHAFINCKAASTSRLYLKH